MLCHFLCQIAMCSVYYCDAYMAWCVQSSGRLIRCTGYSVSQCFKMDEWCDAFLDCGQGDDEIDCTGFSQYVSSKYTIQYSILMSDGRSKQYSIRLPSSPPSVVEFQADGSHKTIMLENNTLCPRTHFQCPDGYCLPVFVLCNDINDCPGWEDETGCDTYTCPGLYRCRGSRVCLHLHYLCDQVFQCPHRDDESFCHITCPKHCVCIGLSYFCSDKFHAETSINARYVDVRGTGMSLRDFSDNHLLIHLSLARCRMTQIQDLHLPNLLSLDLSDNHLHVIDVRHFRLLGNLRVLFLARNPLTSQVFTHLPTDTPLPPLQDLDLSGIAVVKMDMNVFNHFLQLKSLNLSFCGLDNVTGSGFSSQSQISSVDIRGNPLTSFSPGFLSKAASLQRVWADSYKVCCPQVLPEGFSLVHCHSPGDAVSSCHMLLKQEVYRVSAFIQASLALLGNVVNFVIHVYVKKGFARQSHGVFFLHLCLSHAVMGVYQAIIAAADLGYHGDYLWQDVTWRGSVVCHLAGLLYLLSTQTSMVLTYCLTLDPLLHLFFPGSRRHFTVTSAHVVSALTWICCLSVFGSLLVTSQLGQTALCVPPLPTGKREAGHGVVFGVTVVVSWVLVVLQVIIQGALVHYSHTHPLAFVKAVSTCRHMDSARRYSSVARLHLLCWLPLGMLAVLTSRGARFAGEVTSALTLVILPISPSLCSAVYYISVWHQTQRHRQQERLLQRAEWRKTVVGMGKA